MKQICCFCWAAKAKRLSASGSFAPPDHLTRVCPWTPMGAPSPYPIIGSHSVCSPCVSQSTPHFLTWRRPCAQVCNGATYPRHGCTAAVDSILALCIVMLYFSRSGIIAEIAFVSHVKSTVSALNMTHMTFICVLCPYLVSFQSISN